MTQQIFRDKYFEVSESGLHLLRNGFRYRSIALSDIQLVWLGKGKSIKNWIALLILGIILTGGALLFAYSIWNFFNDPLADGDIYIEEIAAVFVAFFIGLYCIVASQKREQVIEFRFVKGAERFATASLSSEGKLDGLVTFLQDHTRVENTMIRKV